jgi:hypothetical protein
MTLQTRLVQLEARGSGRSLTPAEREAAIERYAEAHQASAGAYPGAISPAAHCAAITTAHDPAQQRLLACMLPGDDNI